MFFPHLRSFVEVRHRQSYNFIPKIVNSLDSLECKQDRNWNEKWAHWNNVSNNLNHCFKFFLHSRSIFCYLSHDPVRYKIVRWSFQDRKLCDKVHKFISDLILWHFGRFPWWIFTSRICQIVASFILISINSNSTVFCKIHINRLSLGNHLFYIKNVHTAK